MRPRSITRARRIAVAAMSAAALLATPQVAAAGGSGVAQDLAAARAATAAYHDVEAARADGYVPVGGCAASPYGGMGYHYLNPALVGGELDVRRPQLLLYAPTAGGGLRLSGVEYFVPDADQDPSTDHDRPTLFGRPFDGPMPGHEPGMPVHYDLHVWVWQPNPSGMFAAWNPEVSC